MALNTSIEWTQATWNPLTGCTKVSPGCKNCYAELMAHRLRAMGSPNYANGFKLTFHHHMLRVPMRWKRPRFVFVNSMSDLFHEDVSFDFILEVFDVIRHTPHHTFQILTKRSLRLAQAAEVLSFPDNAWVGVTVETADYLYRVDHIRSVHAKIKFLSFEPLLGPIPEFDLQGIDWVIVGGESGPRARPMRSGWVTTIRDQCLSSRVPFFFKQWGGKNRKQAGRTLDGLIWDEMPSPPDSVMTRDPD